MMHDAGWEQTRAEWEQAWNQVRHFESMRGQWLGFFFTAVLGVVAIVGPRLDVRISRTVVVIAILGIVFETWSAALYLAVARLNEVHRYNDTIIFAIRDASPAAVDLAPYGRPPAPPRKGRLGALASTKKASELVVLFGVWLFSAALIANVVNALTVAKISGAATAVAALAAFAGVAVFGFCGWARRGS